MIGADLSQAGIVAALAECIVKGHIAHVTNEERVAVPGLRCKDESSLGTPPTAAGGCQRLPRQARGRAGHRFGAGNPPAICLAETRSNRAHERRSLQSAKRPGTRSGALHAHAHQLPTGRARTLRTDRLTRGPWCTSWQNLAAAREAIGTKLTILSPDEYEAMLVAAGLRTPACLLRG